jgi:hypothetical protein
MFQALKATEGTTAMGGLAGDAQEHLDKPHSRTPLKNQIWLLDAAGWTNTLNSGTPSSRTDAKSSSDMTTQHEQSMAQDIYARLSGMASPSTSPSSTTIPLSVCTKYYTADLQLVRMSSFSMASVDCDVTAVSRTQVLDWNRCDALVVQMTPDTNKLPGEPTVSKGHKMSSMWQEQWAIMRDLQQQWERDDIPQPSVLLCAWDSAKSCPEQLCQWCIEYGWECINLGETSAASEELQGMARICEALVSHVWEGHVPLGNADPLPACNASTRVDQDLSRIVDALEIFDASDEAAQVEMMDRIMGQALVSSSLDLDDPWSL